MQLYARAALLSVTLMLAARTAFASGACSAACPDNWRPIYAVDCLDPALACACGLAAGNPQCVAASSVPSCTGTVDCTSCACLTATPTITLTPTVTRTPTITVTPTITLTPTITDTPTITPTPTDTPFPCPGNFCDFTAACPNDQAFTFDPVLGWICATTLAVGGNTVTENVLNVGSGLTCVAETLPTGQDVQTCGVTPTGGGAALTTITLVGTQICADNAIPPGCTPDSVNALVFGPVQPVGVDIAVGVTSMVNLWGVICGDVGCKNGPPGTYVAYTHVAYPDGNFVCATAVGAPFTSGLLSIAVAGDGCQ